MSDTAAVVAGLNDALRNCIVMADRDAIKAAIAHIEIAAREPVREPKLVQILRAQLAANWRDTSFIRITREETERIVTALTNQPAAEEAVAEPEPLEKPIHLLYNGEVLCGATASEPRNACAGCVAIARVALDNLFKAAPSVTVTENNAKPFRTKVYGNILPPDAPEALRQPRDITPQPPADEPARQGEDREVDACVERIANNISFNNHHNYVNFRDELRSLVAHLRPPRTEPVNPRDEHKEAELVSLTTYQAEVIEQQVAKCNSLAAELRRERDEIAALCFHRDSLQAEVERKTEEAATLRREMQAGQWVSCAERLPEDSEGLFLVVVNGQWPELRDPGTVRRYPQVFHSWMPIGVWPEPPQSESGGVEP